MFDDSVHPEVQANILDYLENGGSLWVGGITCYLSFHRQDAKEPWKDAKYNDGYRNRESPFSGTPRGTACHYNLRYCSDEHIIVNRTKAATSKGNEAFLLWLARDCPYSHGVLNKDDEKQILTQGVVIDPKIIGMRATLWLCKAARYCIEDQFRPPVWKQLVEAGCDPLMAFIGCSILSADGSPARGTTHNSLYGYANKAGIKEYYTETLAAKKYEDQEAAKNLFYGEGANWGSLKGKKERKPDGWGGYVEVETPGDAKDFAHQLNLIKEGKE